MANEPGNIQIGDIRIDERGINQVYVPAGCFVMGSEPSDIAAAISAFDVPEWATRGAIYETPAHEVCLTKAYWIDQTEVTNASFAEFVADEGYLNQSLWSEDGWKWITGKYLPILPHDCEGGDNHPRVCITFYEAEAFAHWRGGQLPTQAQWEFAARGPENNIYPWGDDWDASRAHVIDVEEISVVGAYPTGTSWVGAMDMAGNAMEWVADWLDEEYYLNSPINDPTGPETGHSKVEKGGWWGSNAFVSRSAYAYYEDPPNYQDHHIGFRVVTPAEPE